MAVLMCMKYFCFDYIQKRWIHPSSGKTYNLDFNPPNVPVSYRLKGEFYDLMVEKSSTLELPKCETLPLIEIIMKRLNL